MKAYELDNVKKVYVIFAEDGSTVSLDDYCGAPRFALYNGIPELDGGWMMETNGAPVAETDLTDTPAGMDDYCATELSSIRDILSDPLAPWESANEEDVAYISDWLKDWGF